VARSNTLSRGVAGVSLAAAGMVFAASVGAQDWDLTDGQRAELARGEILVLADVSASQGDVLAAVQIAAPAERIFRTMTDCGEALQFVPHLERCRVLESADDDSWQLVEHAVDLSWYLPRIDYVFRAQYEPFRRIRFTHVRGDLLENEGMWELQTLGESDRRATILTYRVRIVPRQYVPRWVVRSSLRRDLPLMLRALRDRCEQ
jgi:uncharacterized membrane protein